MGTQQRLFEYSVIRYVPDQVRDEAINVGVLLRSTEDREFDHKIVTDFGKSTRIPDAPILKEALEKLIAEYNGTESLQDMCNKMTYKIRLSEPRSMMVSNIKEDKEVLFNEFVSIRGASARKSSVSRMIRSHIWNKIKLKNGLENKLVVGKDAKFTFDYYYNEIDPRFISIISFNNNYALDKITALYLSVSDIINVHAYKIDYFRPLLIKPDIVYVENAIHEHYDEAVDILNSRGYQFLSIDKNRDWKNQVDSILQT